MRQNQNVSTYYIFLVRVRLCFAEKIKIYLIWKGRKKTRKRDKGLSRGILCALMHSHTFRKKVTLSTSLLRHVKWRRLFSKFAPQEKKYSNHNGHNMHNGGDNGNKMNSYDNTVTATFSSCRWARIKCVNFDPYWKYKKKHTVCDH